MINAATIYGDSVLKGVTLEGDRYVVDRTCEEEFSAKRSFAVRNLCRFGATIEKGISLISRDLMLHGAPEGCAVVEFGGNDCDFAWEEIAAAPQAEHRCKTPPEQFRKLYREALELLRQAGAKPVAAVPIPIDPDRYFRWFCRNGLSGERILQWLGDVNSIYRWEEWYSVMVRETARELSVPLVDLRSAFLGRRRMDGLLCEDGIHPTHEGRRVIFEAFGQALDAAPA